MTIVSVEYEAVRADGLRFFIATHHENPERDGLIVEHERYSIVQKLSGEPARIAFNSIRARSDYSTSSDHLGAAGCNAPGRS